MKKKTQKISIVTYLSNNCETNRLGNYMFATWDAKYETNETVMQFILA